MPVRTLPPRPSLVQLKLQARELAKDFRAGKRSAAARVSAHLPKPKAERAHAEGKLALAAAQFVLAREYGLRDWAHLKQHAAIGAKVARFKPHPRFDEAVAALDAGDLAKLKQMLAADPSLAAARGNLKPPFHYFTAATLLHHVAGNPFRVPLPGNIAEIAQALIEAGADPHATTCGPNQGTTMGLIVTSKQASDAGASGPLMDVLMRHGVKLDLASPDALTGPLANHAPRAAERMLELGAKADVIVAAALGRMELLRDCFDDQGALKEPPVRKGRALSERDAVGLALLFAYVRGCRDAVNFLLEKDGNWEITGVNNGAALHRAAIEGDLPMVQRLVARGASLSNRENPFHATPYSWADHGKQKKVLAWMRAHAKIDLHDAICFGLAAHARARLAEDPASVARRLDQWDLPQATPLHCAALKNRAALAKLLLARGADAHAVAGDGRTALEIAEAAKAAEVLAVLGAV
ncbi:MAG: hypothetical protein KIS92_24620 [Planctomycetota bacterium]|nr:hypothetical protein [Planctomycetota bacterium]